MADRSSNTEEPTQRRLEKARREGQFANSKAFVSAVQFLVFTGILASLGEGWLRSLQVASVRLFGAAFSSEITVPFLSRTLWQLAWQLLLPLCLAGMALATITIAMRLATTGFGMSWKKLAPQFSRFNPLAKLREMPSQNIPMLLQALLMLPLFLWAVYVLARDQVDAVLLLPLNDVSTGAAFIGHTLMRLFWKAGVVFMLFGSADLFRQIQKHKSELKMSKQEIKEEMKELDGNPQMKAKIRRLQRDSARRQMMKEVPGATAVVVNPTHYAVAIRYAMDSMAAPLVVAKGKNYLALRIRQKAIENQVPIIENPPLAQALYKSVDVGQEIPPHLYRAVAEILAYVFKLMNGRLPGN